MNNKNDIIISVVVPFLNEEDYIEKCIESLLNQTFSKENYEVIFVDNGSTDHSSSIVRRYPQIKLLHEPIKNLHLARNRGIATAQGQILAWTDADCEVSKNWLAEILFELNVSEMKIILGKRLFPANKSLSLKLIEDFENSYTNFVITSGSSSNQYAYSNNMAFKMELFKRYGPLSSQCSADTEFLQKCLNQEKGLKIIYADKIQMTHLEIFCLSHWFEKLKFYSNKNRALKDSGYEALSLNSLLRIYQQCINANHYPFLYKFHLFTLVFLRGLICLLGQLR